ncbi:MAG TPA: hypothetical protein VLD57_02930 [Blastocatellia bacterium]|nr:hypothetical protein [Blastocatellia bacterium]
MKFRTLFLLAAFVMPAFSLLGVDARAQATSVFASRLIASIKLILTPAGRLLVAEAGNGPNTGRISIIDQSGNRRTLLDGLPSGFAPPNNELSGPGGLTLRGRTLFITTGGLISPTSMARNEMTGDIFITQIFTGQVIRVPAQ